MTKYRICENEYGYFQVQKYRNPWKIGRLTILKGKWVCGAYENFFGMETGRGALFNAFTDAENCIRRFKKDEEKANENWKCAGTVYR